MASVRREAKRDKPADFWAHGDVGQREVHEYHWSTILERGKGKPRLRGDSLVTSISWDDTSAVLTGSIDMTLPEHPIDLTEGHVVRLRRRPLDGGGIIEQWAMRIQAPTRTLPDHGMSATLGDDLAYLQLSKDDFRYRKDKAHPKGWLYHNIVAAIAKRYGIRVGKIPAGKHYIKKFEETGVSPLDAIIAAVKKEKVAAGRKFVLAWRNGALTITPLTRSKELLVLGPQLLEVSYSTTTVKEGYANSLTIRGTKKVGKKGHKRKLNLKVESKEAIKRYGFVHAIVDSDADSEAEARTEAKTKLREAAKPERELTLTLTNAPWLRRGQAIRFAHVDLDIKQVVFVSEARHSITDGVHTVEATMRFDDPYTDKHAQRVRVGRISKAKSKGRKTEAGDAATGGTPYKASAPRAAQRSDKKAA